MIGERPYDPLRDPGVYALTAFAAWADLSVSWMLLVAALYVVGSGQTGQT